MPPVAGRMPTCQRTAPGSHSRGGSGYTGEPSGRGHARERLAEQEAGARMPLHGMRRAAPQGHGAGLLQGRELQVPAFPAGRHRAFRDRAELAGGDDLAAGRAQDPQPFGRQGQPRREVPAVRGEEQDRVRGRHDLQLGHVIPAGQRDVDGTDRPGQRVRGRRIPRAAPHRDGIAVRGHLPGGGISARVLPTIAGRITCTAGSFGSRLMRGRGGVVSARRAAGWPGARATGAWAAGAWALVSLRAASTKCLGSRTPARSGSRLVSRSSRSRQRSVRSRA